MNGVPGENFAVGTRQKHNNQSWTYIFSQALDSRQLERHATEMSDCRGLQLHLANNRRRRETNLGVRFGWQIWSCISQAVPAKSRFLIVLSSNC
jgi:hypothetical protein